MLSSNSDDDSWMETPQKELDIYAADEDLSYWTFDKIFADSRWQETNLMLIHDADNFSDPQLVPTMPSTTEPLEWSLEYFRQFWHDEVLDDIIQETNM